jgi:hypothetical protein
VHPAVFLDRLAEHRPDLLPRYRDLYRRGAYMRQADRQRLADMAHVPGTNPWKRGEGGEQAPQEFEADVRKVQQQALF